jgi:hypothetical protein
MATSIGAFALSQSKLAASADEAAHIPASVITKCAGRSAKDERHFVGQIISQYS